MDKLTNELIAKVANRLNLEPALLKTVTVVECGNRDGFLPSGRPQILFEGHIMWKQLKEKLDKEGKRTYLYDLAKRNPSLVYQNGPKNSTWEVKESGKDSKQPVKLMKTVLICQLLGDWDRLWASITHSVDVNQ